MDGCGAPCLLVPDVTSRMGDMTKDCAATFGQNIIKPSEASSDSTWSLLSLRTAGFVGCGADIFVLKATSWFTLVVSSVHVSASCNNSSDLQTFCHSNSCSSGYKPESDNKSLRKFIHMPNSIGKYNVINLYVNDSYVNTYTCILQRCLLMSCRGSYVPSAHKPDGPKMESL